MNTEYIETKGRVSALLFALNDRAYAMRAYAHPSGRDWPSSQFTPVEYQNTLDRACEELPRLAVEVTRFCEALRRANEDLKKITP